MCWDAGIRPVRLPPYHCEFNPIELVWAKSKGAVAKRNVTYNLKKAMEIMKEETCKCDAAYWTKLEGHVMKEEDIAWGGDALATDAVAAQQCQSIVLTFSSGSSSDTDSEED